MVILGKEQNFQLTLKKNNLKQNNKISHHFIM